jgi:hypothetical protein
VGQSAGPNVYAYCHDDPINLIDLIGLWEIPSWVAHVDSMSRHSPLTL